MDSRAMLDDSPIQRARQDRWSRCVVSTRVVRVVAHELSGFVALHRSGAMNRAAWLQDRRMQKFLGVLSRWEAGELSMMEAGELLGMSERQFRRYRGRYEEDGAEGLVDRRLGKPSPKRVPAADARLMLELYGGVYRGW